MRRLAAAAALALLLAGCGDGDDSNAKDDGGPQQTLKLESQLTGVHRVPVGSARGADTQLRLIGQLYVPDDNEATGRSQTTCVRGQRGGGEVYNCTIVFLLPKGRLFGMAISSEDGPSSGAIVGGTRAFAKARGTFDYGTRNDQRVDLTVKLG